MKTRPLLTKSVLLLLFILNSTSFFGQSKYWVFLKDKGEATLRADYVTQDCRDNRKLLDLPQVQYTDVPLNHQYVNQLRALEIDVLTQSKWLNALSAYIPADKMDLVRDQPFVESIEPIATSLMIAGDVSNDIETITALQLINSTKLREEKLTAKDVKIGIIDGWFRGANESGALNHVFANDRVKEVKNFVAPDESPFDNSFGNATNHGTWVMAYLAGLDTSRNEQYGVAIDASYYLATSDDSRKEFRGEEDLWVAALEWMDSLGVRLINSSLGYSFGFDDPAEDYLFTEMNGKTSAIAKAAQIAAEDKGMIIVTSAGNEGKNSFGVISSPADAKGVFAVGAVNEYMLKRQISSVGPTFLPYLKPDISSYSQDGTSWAAPIITGLIACLLQKAPNLDNEKVFEIVKKSGHLYPYGNNYLGYGVPDAERMLKLASDSDVDLNRAKEITVEGDVFKVEDEKYHFSYPIVFHKNGAQEVIEEYVLVSVKNEMTIKRRQGASRTTVDFHDHVVEIFWK